MLSWYLHLVSYRWSFKVSAANLTAGPSSRISHNLEVWGRSLPPNRLCLNISNLYSWLAVWGLLQLASNLQWICRDNSTSAHEVFVDLCFASNCVSNTLITVRPLFLHFRVNLFALHIFSIWPSFRRSQPQEITIKRTILKGIPFHYIFNDVTNVTRSSVINARTNRLEDLFKEYSSVQMQLEFSDESCWGHFEFLEEQF